MQIRGLLVRSDRSVRWFPATFLRKDLLPASEYGRSGACRESELCSPSPLLPLLLSLLLPLLPLPPPRCELDDPEAASCLFRYWEKRRLKAREFPPITGHSTNRIAASPKLSSRLHPSRHHPRNTSNRPPKVLQPRGQKTCCRLLELPVQGPWSNFARCAARVTQYDI